MVIGARPVLITGIALPDQTQIAKEEQRLDNLAIESSMGGNPKQDDLLADEISVAPVDPSTEITVLDTSDIASVQTDWGDDGLWDDFTAEQVNPQS